MRVGALISPYSAEITRVVVADSDQTDLPAWLGLGETASYTRLETSELAGERFADGTLLVTTTERRGTAGDLAAVLATLPIGGLALVLVSGRGEPETGLLTDALVSARCQILQVSALVYEDFGVGILARRVDRFLASNNQAGRDGKPADDLPPILRAVNEHRLEAFASRRLRARLIELEQAQAGQVALHEQAEALSERVEQLQSERQQTHRDQQSLRREAYEARRDLRQAQHRIALLENAAAWQLGSTLLDAVRTPATALPRLPRRLRQIWRQRGQRPPRPALESDPAAGTADDRDRRRMLGFAAGAQPAAGLRIAGVLRPLTRELLRPDAAVASLLPHDSDLVLERSHPSIVLIESAATRPQHPWALAGRAASFERDLDLHRLIDQARSLGTPSVFWWNTPRAESPGLVAIAGQCDLILTAGRDMTAVGWSSGVQLAHANPIGRARRRLPTPALLVDPRVESQPEAYDWTRMALAAAGPLGIDTRLLITPSDIARKTVAGIEFSRDQRLHPDSLPAFARGRALLLVPPAGSASQFWQWRDELMAMVACGAPVVTAPDPLLEEGPMLRFAASPDEFSHVLSTASADDPSVDHLRSALRSIAGNVTTRRRLEQLTGALDLPIRSPDESIAVVSVVDDGMTIDRLVASVLDQKHQPAEVAVIGSPSRGRGLDEIAAAGIKVDLLPADDPRSGLAQAVRRCSSAWLAGFSASRAYPAEHLSDLLIGWECSRAAAIGEVAEPDDFTFVARLDWDSAIVRRSLLEANKDRMAGESHPIDLELLARRGARLFGVAEAPRP